MKGVVNSYYFVMVVVVVVGMCVYVCVYMCICAHVCFSSFDLLVWDYLFFVNFGVCLTSLCFTFLVVSSVGLDLYFLLGADIQVWE